MCVGVWQDIYVEPIEGDDDKGQRMWIVVQILIAFVSDINKDPCLMPICSFLFLLAVMFDSDIQL